MKYQANPVIVEAFRIVGVGGAGDNGVGRVFLLENGHQKIASPEMLARFMPTVGDYWVIQADGYEYLNPADVFTRKYSRCADVTMTRPYADVTL